MDSILLDVDGKAVRLFRVGELAERFGSIDATIIRASFLSCMVPPAGITPPAFDLEVEELEASMPFQCLERGINGCLCEAMF